MKNILHESTVKLNTANEISELEGIAIEIF